ncbi:RpiR family transcriptional regulator [Primorskyibacter sedentarius]|uniref:RpiR family transcriptional regulator n=1 Tax=Primorskyibacter sedentarius TaxID=745311 RepID=A0A4V6NYM1_9RHOB|nr:RpiR family transcriptional regulator [Primorskyibacter sedentarius]
MPEGPGLTRRISTNYALLSAKLREAADYVVGNPFEVATRSLRQVSAVSGISPSTYSRLARALQFENYEDMRESARRLMGNQMPSFAEKAGKLREDGCESLFERHLEACEANCAQMRVDTDRAALASAVKALGQARRVTVFGALASAGITEYLCYLVNYFDSRWTLAGRQGSALGPLLSALTAEDVLLVVTKTPYVRRAVIAAEMARNRGAQSIVLTDSHVCPALTFATHAFIVPTNSPNYFSSYVATLALLEAMIAMLVANSDCDVAAIVKDVEMQNRNLGEFWSS